MSSQNPSLIQSKFPLPSRCIVKSYVEISSTYFNLLISSYCWQMARKQKETRLKGFSLQPRELSVLTSLVEEELSVSGLWHNITSLWPSTSSLLHSASSLWIGTSSQWLSTISLRLSTSSLQQNSKKLRIGTSGLWLKG